MSYCTYSGNFLVVQCLRFCTFDAGDMGSILGQGAKIPHAAERVKGMKRVTWKLNITICKLESQWEFAVRLRELKLELCDSLKGWYWVGGDLAIYLGLIHVDNWQKTTKFCKAVILQLKNKLNKNVSVQCSEESNFSISIFTFQL